MTTTEFKKPNFYKLNSYIELSKHTDLYNIYQEIGARNFETIGSSEKNHPDIVFKLMDKLLHTQPPTPDFTEDGQRVNYDREIESIINKWIDSIMTEYALEFLDGTTFFFDEVINYFINAPLFDKEKYDKHFQNKDLHNLKELINEYNESDKDNYRDDIVKVSNLARQYPNPFKTLVVFRELLSEGYKSEEIVDLENRDMQEKIKHHISNS